MDVIKCPRYDGKDLFNRLLSLLNNQTPTTIIPNIPGCDVLEEESGEFENILQNGEGSIQVIPKITQNYDHMLVHGRSPLKGFGPLIAFNKKYKEKNKTEFFRFVDLSGDRAPIEVQISPVKNGQMSQQFVSTIWQKLSQRVNVACNFINKEGNVEKFGIDKLLLEAYNTWKETHLLKLNDDQRRTEKKIFEMDVVQVVRDILQHNPHCNKVEDIIQTFIPHQQSFPMISPDDVRKVIGKYSIRALIEKDLDKNQYTQELNSIKSNITNMDKLSLDRIKAYVK